MRLHYWDARGRCQSLRFMLADIVEKYPNVDYKETFEKLSGIQTEWPINKQDPNIAGPTRNLPVLHWNKQVLGQTMPIGQFLARKFSLYGKPTDAVNDMDVNMALLDGVVSCAYTDVICIVGDCILKSIDFNDSTGPLYSKIAKIASDLNTLDTILKQSSTKYFYDQQDATIADYFTFEAYTWAKLVSEKWAPSDKCETLMKHEQTMKARPGLAKYFEKKLLLDRWTSSLNEQQWRKKLGEEKK